MGAMIHYLEMPPFIVTLAGMFLARGMPMCCRPTAVPITHEFYDTLQSLYWKAPGGGRLPD
jgi:ribose/xylose/arabinose/galactoside ABC-type transport system permease subunit